MKRWLLLCLPLLLAAALVALLLHGRTGDGGAVHPERKGDLPRPSSPDALSSVTLRGRPVSEEVESTVVGEDSGVSPAPTHRFQGTVREAETGEPLAGAVVEVLVPDGPRFNAMRMLAVGRRTTDADGRYDLVARVSEAEVTGSRYLGYLEIRHPGRVVYRRPYPPLPRGPDEVALPPAGRITGRVTRTDGGDLDGTWVRLVRSGGADAYDAVGQLTLPRPERVAEDGSFVIEHVPLIGRIAVRARAADGAGGASRLLALGWEASPSAEVVVELSSPGALRGRVVDVGGAGLDGTRLDLVPRDLEIHRSGIITTQLKDGAWAFPTVAAGRYELRLVHDELGILSLTEEPFVVPPRRTVDLGRIVVGKGPVVSGRVVAPSGAQADALGNIRVSLWRSECDRFVHTTRAGAFRFRGVERGRYRLRVDDSEWRESQPVLVEAGQEGIVVSVVRAAGRIAVEFQGDHADTVEEFDVYVLDEAPWGGLLRTHDSLDRRDPVTSDLAPGRYDVLVEAEGMSLWQRRGVVVGTGETRVLTVRPEPAPRLRRRVVDVRGESIAWAWVGLGSRSAWPLGPAGAEDADDWLLQARTSETGEFELPLTRPDLVLTAFADGHGSVRAAVSELPADRIVLPTGSPVTGRLVGVARGEDVGGIPVKLDLAGAHRTCLRLHAVSSLDGSFAFAHVADGRWRLEVRSLTGSVVLARELEVRGEPVELGAIPVPVR